MPRHPQACETKSFRLNKNALRDLGNARTARFVLFLEFVTLGIEIGIHFLHQFFHVPEGAIASDVVKSQS